MIAQNKKEKVANIKVRQVDCNRYEMMEVDHEEEKYSKRPKQRQMNIRDYKKDKTNTTAMRE